MSPAASRSTASAKGRLFVLLVALLPPSFFAWTLLDVTKGSFRQPSVVSLTIWGLIYAWLLKTIVYKHFFDPLRHLPRSPTDVFACGHSLEALAQPPGSAFARWAKTVPNDGLIVFKGFLEIVTAVVVTSPEGVADVLNNHAYDFEKPAPPKAFIASLIGEGILLAEGKTHKLQRRIISPAFQGKHIRELVPLFWRKSAEFADVLAKDMEPAPTSSTSKGKTGVIDISDAASRATLDIIGLAGLGRDFATLQDSGDEIAGIFSILTDTSNPASRNYLLAHVTISPWLARMLPIPQFIRIREAAARLRRISIQLLADKRAALAEKSSTTDNVDILSVLLRSASMSDDELVDQLLTFLAAGHETTASATAWATYMLATHPAIQARLRDEVHAALARSPTHTLDADALDAMPYLAAVCSETLRLWPTVTGTARVPVRDTTVAGTRIPAGTQTFLSVLAMNRSAAFWGPDAELFNPERWLAPPGADAATVRERAARGSSSSVYHNITFLHGPRSCIGQGFAQSELRCLVAALVGRFEVRLAEPEKKVEAAGVVTVKPKGGLRVLLTDLKGAGA